jgi:hypothetical protein
MRDTTGIDTTGRDTTGPCPGLSDDSAGGWRLALLGALLSALFAVPLHAGDWTNNGGNAARNGLSAEIGPTAADVLWSGAASSIIAWQPMVSGSRVFVVRQTGFPLGGEPNGSPIVCLDLDTGAVLWERDIPYVAGDWTTWLLGTSNGWLYASRSGNGGTVQQVVHALDQATGATVWTSDDVIDPGFYDGVVFAPNGDLVVGNTGNVKRISAVDGSTEWTSPRVCNVTSSCGVAIHDGGVYAAEPAPGGNVIRKLDLATGASLYETPVMIGFTLQNTPFVGPDGTVYLSRTQNNPITDFFYGFDDTGTALVERWNVPAGWSTTSEFGCGPDGSVYMLDPTWRVRRLDATTGATLAMSVNPIWSGSGGPSPHFAVDAAGKVFVSNGGFSNGRLYSFDDDLSLRWSMAVTNVNQGGPSLGQDGTLVVAGVGSNLFALRSDPTWVDLGGGTTGGAGAPLLTMSGPLNPGSTVTLEMMDGAPSAFSIVFISFSSVPTPFVGGTLHAWPANAQVFVFTDAAGELNGSVTWPGALSGTQLWFQVAMQDPSVPIFGASLSNGVRGTVP